VQDNEGTKDLSVDIPIGKDTFVTIGREENQNGKVKDKVLFGWRFK